MINRSRNTLALAMVGLLSCSACTAEKSSMKEGKTADATSSPSVSIAQPVVTDGVFASNEHLAPVYFDLNRSRINEKAMEAVKLNAEWLKSQPPFLIRVVGYTDARGSAMKNERLSARRAISLRDAYVSQGIPKDRILTDGRIVPASECPGLMEECLSQSRRADTLIEDKSLASR